MDDMDKWRMAGRIAAEALEFGRSLIKNGANIREVCDKIDAKIVELGGLPAWPSQIGLDAVAAHATPDFDDDSVFNNNVVCLDVGAHVDGFVGDNACSVDLSGKHKNVIDAADAALKAAIRTVRAGVSLGEIGRAIETEILRHGIVPVRNLSGHGISKFVIHDKPSVPNYDSKDVRTLKAGQVIAIEPFASDGAGLVVELEQANIFALEHKKPVRSAYAREVLQFIESSYGPLPFCSRWLVKKFGAGKTSLALNDLLRAGILHSHPPLVDKDGGFVAVFEKTMLVTESGCEVLTKL